MNDPGSCVQLLKLNLLSNLILSVLQSNRSLEPLIHAVLEKALTCEHRQTLISVSQDFKQERNRLKNIVSDLKDVKMLPETRKTLSAFLSK